MKIKTFQGRTLEEILPEIRTELGEDAVVLSQKPVVNGGIGGFFGKRMLEVVASDRMPSDEELVEIDEQIAADDDGWSSDYEERFTRAQPATSSIDMTDDWDPGADADLARQFGGIFERSAKLNAYEPVVRVAGSTIDVANEFITDDLIGADVARFEPDVVPTATITTTSHDDISLSTAFNPVETAVPLAPPLSEATAPQTTAVAPPAREITESQRPFDALKAQVASLTERAHESIAHSTDVIDARLQTKVTHLEQTFEAPAPDLSGNTLRASIVEPPTMNSAHRISLEKIDALRNVHLGSANLQTPAVTNSQAFEYAPPKVQRPSYAQHTDPTPHLIDALVSHGVDTDVATVLVDRAIRHRRPFSADISLEELVSQIVAETIPVACGWNPGVSQQRVAFVGASGSGKSSMVAKVAESYARSGFRVGIVSIIAANDHSTDLRSDPLLRRPGLDVRIVSTPTQLLSAIESMHDVELIVFDTPSSAYLDPQVMSMVTRCLETAKVTEVQAVIPLSTSVREAGSVLAHYGLLGVSRMAVSKLDESRFAGQLLNFGFHFNMPITYVSDGPRIPEDIRAASAQEISGLILPTGNRQ